MRSWLNVFPTQRHWSTQDEDMDGAAHEYSTRGHAAVSQTEQRCTGALLCVTPTVKSSPLTCCRVKSRPAPTVSPVSDWNCTMTFAASTLPFLSGGSSARPSAATPRAMAEGLYVITDKQQTLLASAGAAIRHLARAARV